LLLERILRCRKAGALQNEWKVPVGSNTETLGQANGKPPLYPMFRSDDVEFPDFCEMFSSFALIQ